MSPTSGSVGTEVTVKGNNFGSAQSTSYVSFGSVKVTEYTSWSSTQVKVKIPSASYWTRDVKVTTSASASNAKLLKVKPQISAIYRMKYRWGQCNLYWNWRIEELADKLPHE